MEILPVEVMCMIGRHLPVKDLTSCISVSRAWREIFGSDEVWRPWCDVGCEEYLRTTPCKVESKFTSPQSDNSTLSPIGRWRTAYMREAHMWKNWISGNYVEEKIKLKGLYNSPLFLNNDFVLTVGIDLIELIDTTLIPSVSVAQLEIPVPSIGRKPIKVRSDMFVIWISEEDVQVISVDFQSHTLSVKHTFHVNKDRYICDFIIVNYKFVVLGSLFIHIWDLESGKKLKTDINPFQYDNGPCFVHFKHDETVAVIACDDNDNRQCFLYNVKEQIYLPFTVNTSSRQFAFAVVKHYLAVNSGTSIKIYNYQTSQLLHEVSGSDLCDDTVSGCFVFINENKDLVLFSPLTGTFRCLISGVRMFSYFSDKLVEVLDFEDKGLGNSELWKIGFGPAGKTLLDYCYLSVDFDCADINQVHSKLIYYYSKNYITCIHFW